MGKEQLSRVESVLLRMYTTKPVAFRDPADIAALKKAEELGLCQRDYSEKFHLIIEGNWSNTSRRGVRLTVKGLKRVSKINFQSA